MIRKQREKERLPYKRPKIARVVDVPMAQPQMATVSRYVPRPLSGTSQQAIRTGGWVEPGRGGELKFIDKNGTIAITNSAVTFSAASLLNGCVQGTEATNRIGRIINLKSLYMRFSCTLGATSTNGTQVRILVVYDKQANTTAPTITDVLQGDLFLSANNLSNRDRFVTLVDVLTEPISTQGNYSVSDVIYRKINLQTMFNTTNAGTVGDMTSGSVHLFISNAGTLGVADGTFGWRCRIKFTDL